MQIGAHYSHLNGLEWMYHHRPALWGEIQAAIAAVNANTFKTKVSKEKTMAGKMLYAPIELNEALKVEFNNLNWNETRYDYWVTDDMTLTRAIVGLPAADQKAYIEGKGKVAISSYNQTDFVKDRVAVEVQLAKYSFIEYDLFIKHLGFYIGNTIDVGVEIIPMKSMQSEMSSGPGYYERVLNHIARQGRSSPPVPFVLIGVMP